SWGWGRCAPNTPLPAPICDAQAALYARLPTWWARRNRKPDEERFGVGADRQEADAKGAQRSRSSPPHIAPDGQIRHRPRQSPMLLRACRDLLNHVGAHDFAEKCRAAKRFRLIREPLLEWQWEARLRSLQRLLRNAAGKGAPERDFCLCSRRHRNA